MRVVPVGVRRLRHGQPGKAAVGPVQHVDADLALHHALLVGEVLLRDGEALHPVGLRPEHGLDGVRRDDLEVIGEVEARRTVEDAAVRLHELDELELPQILGALEHHVLEEVGEAGPVARLDAETDAVIDRDHGYRRGVVGREDHLEPVRELLVLHGDPQPALLLRRLIAVGGRSGRGPVGAGGGAEEREPRRWFHGFDLPSKLDESKTRKTGAAGGRIVLTVEIAITLGTQIRRVGKTASHCRVIA